MNKITIYAGYLLLALFMVRGSWCYGQESDAKEWTNYFMRSVQNGMQFPQPTNEVMYHAVKTSIAKAMASQDYLMKRESDYSMRVHRPISANSTEWEARLDGKIQKIWLAIIESDRGRDGAMEGLSALMSSHTTMGGPVYEVMEGGPGDVCLQFKNQNAVEGNRPKVLFFCRGNVAVQVVRLLPNGDVMPVARLVDAAIVKSCSETK